MFNSNLINYYGSGLKDAIWERQKEIVEVQYDLWLDLENTGEDIFEGYFRWFFPLGFIERDKERAKKVIRDIRDIVNSPIIRYNPDAIHCYVMYHMIEAWFDDEYIQSLDLVPDVVKDFVASLDNKGSFDDGPNLHSENDESYEDDPSAEDFIIAWFSDKDSCMGDFEDTYDQDYMDESIAEEVAVVYLESDTIPDTLGIDIRELVDLLPNDLYKKVIAKLDKEDHQRIIKANKYIDTIWFRVEECFNTFTYGESLKVTSYQGAIDILSLFKDWVENNGGWKEIQNASSSIKEAAIHRLIILGGKTYLKDTNLDISCENNIGVGQEDIKISRGNDKTIVEVKLTSNSSCKHGFEKQLPRYAEAEHTENMIFCLVDIGEQKVVDEIRMLQDKGIEEGKTVPDIMVIDAKPQKSASIL